MAEMKTAATVLQEMMVKRRTIPEYEYISKSGPQHQATFEYRCKAQGFEVTASARSKKDAKQEVAKLMLHKLASAGYSVPAPYGLDNYPAQAGLAGGDTVEAATAGARSYVALLKELCTEFHLPGAEYDLVSDTGPAHQRHFTMRVRVGQHQREATSTTKKAARQIAAEKLYSYLRENLARITKDFDEDDALVRAHERVMARYLATTDEASRKPDLDPMALSAGRAAVAEAGCGDPCSELAAAVAALGLEHSYSSLAALDGGPLVLLALQPTAPALLLAGTDRAAAASAALRYLRTAL